MTKKQQNKRGLKINNRPSFHSEDHNGFEWLPDGSGGVNPCPYVLTEQEAIRFIRLDLISVKNPDATLRRYRKDGLLQAVQISKAICYTRPELIKFVKKLMEQNPR